MAVREILTRGESALLGVPPVTKFDQKLWDLIDDMKETLAEAGGVGLAAPRWAFCAGWSSSSTRPTRCWSW